VPSEPTREELLAQIKALKLAADQKVAVPVDMLRRSIGKSTTPDQIQSQIDAITTVISSGVNSAGYGDKRTEFRSLNELRQILNGLEDDLAELLGGGGRVRQIRMTTQADKGL
jgi:hypothetical protein